MTFLSSVGSNDSIFSELIHSNNSYLFIPILIMLFIMLASPAIQITLSTKKNRYIGLIFPAFTFIVFGSIMLFIDASFPILLLMAFGPSVALIAFHVIIRKNMRY